MADHDGGYKLLFGNQRMVEDLVRGFVPETWVDRLDFSTLQLCDGSYVTEGHRRLEQDMVWRVEWKGEATEDERRRGERSWLYVYLLLEFQSRVERFMAVRMLNYLSLLYPPFARRGAVPSRGSRRRDVLSRLGAGESLLSAGCSRPDYDWELLAVRRTRWAR